MHPVEDQRLTSSRPSKFPAPYCQARSCAVVCGERTAGSRCSCSCPDSRHRRASLAPRLRAYWSGRHAHQHLVDDATIQRGPCAPAPGDCRQRGRVTLRRRARACRCTRSPCVRPALTSPGTVPARDAINARADAHSRGPHQTDNVRSSLQHRRRARGGPSGPLTQTVRLSMSTRSSSRSGRDRTAGGSTAAIGRAMRDFFMAAPCWRAYARG